MPSGRLIGLAVVLAGTMPYLLGATAGAEERMHLGAPDLMEAGLIREFRGSVGDRVFFADRSAELSPRARLAIGAQADWLKRKPGLIVVIEGHADDSGTSDDNMRLSLQRADAVRNRLIELGIATERVRVTAFGRNRTVADCTGSLCAAQNRRAVTVVRAGTPVPTTAPQTSRKAERAHEPWHGSGRGIF
jgi:peptidoglycan-associated lipoprotein